MPDNEVELLKRIIDDHVTRMPSELTLRSDQFVYFGAEQALKDFDLSPDELLNGIVDGEGDGGIDAVYVFANGKLQDDDDIPTDLPSKYSLDLYIFQAKEGSFEANALSLMNETATKLFKLGHVLESPEFNPRLIERVNIFRKLLAETAVKFPKISVHVVYPANKSTAKIATRVRDKAEDLRTTLRTVVGADTQAEVIFLGSSELLDAASRQQSETLELKYENNIETEHGYLALVPVLEFAKFISDQSSKLKRYMFEANVRDYQGRTTVNKSISDTLSDNSGKGPDFWWLNNGITVLSSQVTSMSRKFIIQDPQIVNGLQTSESIYRYFVEQGGAPDSRLVMVKIIETDDEDLRNSVIVATNSQNTLPSAAVRAGDRIQKLIEQHFLREGYFYDRRKNHYKNLGKPASKIFGIQYLAQAALSIGFNSPDEARARPSNIMKSDSEYQRVFTNRIDLKIYLWMAKVQRDVDVRLRSSSFAQDFKSNVRFHLSMLIARKLAGMIINHPSQLSGIASTAPDIESVFDDVAEELQKKIKSYQSTHSDMNIDAIAKSSDFVSFLD